MTGTGLVWIKDFVEKYINEENNSSSNFISFESLLNIEIYSYITSDYEKQPRVSKISVLKLNMA